MSSNPDAVGHLHLLGRGRIEDEPDWVRDPLDPGDEWRRLFAEAFGTLLLVVAASGAAMAARLYPGTVSGSAQVVAPGLTVMAVIYFMGMVSGAHLNPAVTLAFALRGNFPWRRVPGYIAAELVGAVIAVLILRLILGDVALDGASRVGLLTSPWQAAVTEMLLTCGLVGVILGTAAGAHNVGTNAALAVGGYIALAGLWAAPVSGASMNPARSLAPALISGHWQNWWVYVVGPLAGAVIAVGIAWVLRGRPTSSGDGAAQGEAQPAS